MIDERFSKSRFCELGAGSSKAYALTRELKSEILNLLDVEARLTFEKFVRALNNAGFQLVVDRAKTGKLVVKERRDNETFVLAYDLIVTTLFGEIPGSKGETEHKTIDQ